MRHSLLPSFALLLGLSFTAPSEAQTFGPVIQKSDDLLFYNIPLSLTSDGQPCLYTFAYDNRYENTWTVRSGFTLLNDDLQDIRTISVDATCETFQYTSKCEKRAFSGFDHVTRTNEYPLYSYAYETWL